MAAELGEPNSWGSATAGLALDDADHGLAEAALEEAREAIAHLVSAGAGLALPFVSWAVAYSQAALGMLDAADETLRSLAAQGPGLTGFDQWTYPVWANVSRLSGDLENADAHASKALELATFVGSDSSLATAKLAQGRIAAARGEYAAAEAKIHEAIAVAVPRGFRPLLADALAGLAMVAAGLESYEEALRLLGASDRALEDLDGRTRWKDEQAQLDELRERLESELDPSRTPRGASSRSRTRSAGRTALEGSASARSEAGKASPQPSCGWWSSSRKD